MGAPVRYHLHVAEARDGKTRFQTQEADTESVAAATAAMLASRGFVVWLYEHDHGVNSYRELGMFIDGRFLPTRPSHARATDRHRLR